MANKPSKEELARYNAYKKKSDYKAAAKVLAPYRDDPEIDALIKKLAMAHKRQSQVTQQVGSPKRKAKANDASSKGIIYLVVVMLVIVCVVLFMAVVDWNQVTVQVTLTPSVTPSATPTVTPFPTPSDPLAQYLLSEISGLEYIDNMQSSDVPGRNEQRYDMTIYLYRDVDINSTLETLSATIANYREGNVPEGERFSLNVDLWQGEYGETWRFTGSAWARRSVNGMSVTTTPIPTGVPTVPYAGPALGGTGNTSSGGTNSSSSNASSNCDCSGDIYNCNRESFSSMQEARACYNKCLAETGRDVHGLDGNNDGVICEDGL